MNSRCHEAETFRVKNSALGLEYDVCTKCGLPWVVTDEEWADIQGYKDYEICTDGRIRRKPREVLTADGKNKRYEEMILKEYITPNMHCRINLSSGGKRWSPQVHKLVAKSWLPNPNNYREVEHITGNILDNSYLNLKWIKE